MKKKTDVTATKVRFDDKKVWVKPYAVLANMAKCIENRVFYFDNDCKYIFLEDMIKYCGKRVTLAKIEEQTVGGEFVFRINEDNGEFYWYGGWLTNVDPTMFPERFKVEEEPMFVSDFSDSEENLSDGEKFFYGILPQLKEIVVNAYNKGVEDGKAECL